MTAQAAFILLKRKKKISIPAISFFLLTFESCMHCFSYEVSMTCTALYMTDTSGYGDFSTMGFEQQSWKMLGDAAM